MRGEDGKTGTGHVRIFYRKYFPSLAILKIYHDCSCYSPGFILAEYTYNPL
jgi:hypothetical protein